MQGNDVYYNSGRKRATEDLKTRTIGELDDPDASYSFDIFLVFEHVASGRIYYGQDSGCSCPSPFEDYYFDAPDDTNFTEVTRANLDDFVREMNSHYENSQQDEKRKIEREVRKLVMKDS